MLAQVSADPDHVFVINGEFQTPPAWLENYESSMLPGEKLDGAWEKRYEAAVKIAPKDSHVIPYEKETQYVKRQESLGVKGKDARVYYRANFSGNPDMAEIFPHNTAGIEWRKKAKKTKSTSGDVATSSEPRR